MVYGEKTEVVDEINFSVVIELFKPEEKISLQPSLKMYPIADIVLLV